MVEYEPVEIGGKDVCLPEQKRHHHYGDYTRGWRPGYVAGAGDTVGLHVQPVDL
jgi:hypothetical protein